MKKLLLILFVFTGVVGYAASIKISKHNLSSSGPGSVTATTETEICIFCHTPHNASTVAPLWNRYDSGATYTLYNSSTTKASIGQPTGSSKLCLSCHDGTVALGMVRSRSVNITLNSGVTTMPVGAGNLGTDLSDDHPVSFAYNAALVSANGQLNSPPASGPVHLDAANNVQCSSCHDPHDPQYGSFLVMNNTASALCITCHKMTYWSATSHSTSSTTWNGAGTNPWFHTTNLTTVAANACENCHDPHSAAGKARLMNYAAEEQNCYSCHNGNAAAKNVQSDFSKASIHPVALTTGTHDPTEATLVPSATGHHVECADCHNPHAANTTTNSVAGGATGALIGVAGINASGSAITTVTYEYELCFRCHADTAKGPGYVTRQYPNLNTRQEFQNLNGTNSFHPVVLVGRGADVPSLKSPWTTASKMGCTDCHNSNTSPAAGGTGANGPHGSTVAPILERAMNLADTATTVANAALCDKCHTFVNTAFPGHTTHNGFTSCTTCHDPHGSPNKHLINMNTTVVSARSGVLSYTSTGTRHGYCTIVCHGEQHGSGDHNY